MGEARLCLRNLAVPPFHHELVKQALVAAMEDESAAKPLLELLKGLADSGDVSPMQMQKVWKWHVTLSALLLIVTCLHRIHDVLSLTLVLGHRASSEYRTIWTTRALITPEPGWNSRL